MAHILKIHLDVINKATNNFANVRGGGFGGAYKGKIADLDEHGMVALKRLDGRFGQGDAEFWKEVMMLSLYKHENIVSLSGFCNDIKKRILVYSYAPNGSLNRHLNNDNLRWIGRLKICIGAARGLVHLHSENTIQESALHRDLKSPMFYWMKIGMLRSQILVSPLNRLIKKTHILSLKL
ncbi:putative serine/threonine-protein kinase PBL22 [Bidens hawaiensis]|uniref:putative serine/threonine-protein kinase PBL22 n=1 Tax=Bidens hawaiensis TaxID=980011 RepID=UPI00404A891A